MTSLNNIIQKYAVSEFSDSSKSNTKIIDFSLGAEDEVDAEDEEAKRSPEKLGKTELVYKQNLRTDLEKVKQDNNRYFLVAVLMIVLLFIASMVIVLTNLDRPNIVTTVMTAFGVSTAGLIWLMIKLWREKSNTEFLLALAINMDNDALAKIINILAKRLPN